jgi:hypothetical protein
MHYKDDGLEKNTEEAKRTVRPKYHADDWARKPIYYN